MATAQSPQNQATGGQMQQGQGTATSPLDNLTYDLVTVLHEKCKGLEAYDKYLSDAQTNAEARQLLETIRQADVQHVQQLRDCLSKVLVGGSGGRAQTGQGS
ncbi:MAG TPA: hypothetical protein VFS43_31320 [Polyangiaceae bacterium]|nr:hypothetical protein [Polyangiaceae bacterium]